MPIAENISAATTQALRWLRRCLTVEAMLDGLKTLAWVAPLTILIWVYADEEKPANGQDETVQIELHSASPDKVVSLTNAHDAMILVNLAGSKSGIDALSRELSKKAGENPTVRIDVPATMGDGVHPLQITDKVRNADMFRRAGVSVVKVSPDAIDVNVDTLKTVEAEVKPSPGAPLMGTTVFEPQTVHLTAPARLFPPGNQPLVVYAQIPATGEYAKPGSQQNVPLPLTLPFTGDHVSVAPAVVNGTYMIKQSDVPYTIEFIPIRRSFPPGKENEWSVEADATLKNVEVKGPKDQIQMIIDGKVLPFATLRIDGSEAMGRSYPKKLDYNFGEPDVTLNTAKAPEPTIEYTVTRRGTNSP